MEILTSPTLGLLVGIAGIGVTIAIFLYSRKRKRLTYSYVVVQSEERCFEPIHSPFTDKTVALIMIRNSGNVAIKKSDYSGPLLLRCSQKYKPNIDNYGFISLEHDLDVSVSSDNNNDYLIAICPLTLNIGDVFFVAIGGDFLLSRNTHTYFISGKISGGLLQDIRDTSLNRSSYIAYFFASATAFTLPYYGISFYWSLPISIATGLTLKYAYYSIDCAYQEKQHQKFWDKAFSVKSNLLTFQKDNISE